MTTKEKDAAAAIDRAAAKAKDELRQATAEGEALGDRTKAGLEAVADKAKAVASTVVDRAKDVGQAAEQKLKDAGRAVRDAAIHTKDKLHDLKDKLD